MRHSDQPPWRRGLVACAFLLLTVFGSSLFAQETQAPPALPDNFEAQVLALHASAPSRILVPAPLVMPPASSPHTAKKFDKKHDLEKIGDRGIGGGMNFWSLTAEEKLGRQLAENIDRTSRLVTDPVITEYVNRVGQNLLRASDAKLPLTVKILDDDEVNALSLPGGFLYVTTGLLKEADEESQLAGVMGHELGHISARHGTRTVSKGMLWSMILQGAAAAAPGATGQVLAGLGASVSSEMIFLKLSRDSEYEADLLAVQYIYTAGYDPGEYVQFFEKIKALQKKKPSAIGKLFASHPPVEERIKKCQLTVDQYLPDKASYIIDTSNFEDVHKRLLALSNNRLSEVKEDKERPQLRRRTPDGAGAPSGEAVPVSPAPPENPEPPAVQEPPQH